MENQEATENSIEVGMHVIARGFFIGSFVAAVLVLASATFVEAILIWAALLPSSDNGADSQGLVWLYGLGFLAALWVAAMILVFRPVRRRLRRVKSD